MSWDRLETMTRWMLALLILLMPLPAAATCAFPEPLRGEWKVVVNEDMKRRLELMRFALRDPAPSNGEIKRRNLSEKEAELVRAVIAVASDDEAAARLREQVEATTTLTITISAEDFRARTGKRKTESTCSAVSETSDGWLLELQTEDRRRKVRARRTDERLMLDDGDQVLELKPKS